MSWAPVAQATQPLRDQPPEVLRMSTYVARQKNAGRRERECTADTENAEQRVREAMEEKE